MKGLLPKEMDCVTGGMLPPIRPGDGGGGGGQVSFSSQHLSGSKSSTSETISYQGNSWTATAKHNLNTGSYNETLTGHMGSSDSPLQVSVGYGEGGQWNGDIGVNYDGNHLEFHNDGKTSFSYDFDDGWSLTGNYNASTNHWSIAGHDEFGGDGWSCTADGSLDQHGFQGLFHCDWSF